MKENSKIESRTYDFAVMIVEIYKYLTEKKREFIMSKQLLRSGTSIGANVTEAQAAQSKKDFIAKMSIASKESRETRYWLNLLNESSFLDDYYNKETALKEVHEVIRIITRIVKTSQESIDNKN